MKRNGTYGKSKREDEFYATLVEALGEDDVQRQVTVNGWPIDFYARSLDTYIQFDGTYWHGLDRPLNTIMEFKSPRDRVIYGHWLTDNEQNEWFARNGVRLIRVRDTDFLVDPSMAVSSVLSPR